MSSIPVAEFVKVTPAVIANAGDTLGMNGIFLTADTSIPIGTVQQFASYDDVSTWFGSTAIEALMAQVYFAGFANAAQTPSVLYFAQYNTAAVSAYLRGGSVSSMTLTQLQALSGTITVSIDGTSTTSAAIDLSGATSFSNAASLIQTGLQGGTPATTATVTYDALRTAFVITSSTTGSSSTLAFPTDSSLSPSLNLTSAKGAVLSQGAAAATPSTLMNSIIAVTKDWATFTHCFDPDSGAAGGPIKVEFATWNAGENNAYLYVPWDTDATPSTTLPDSACFAAQISSLNGSFPIWDYTTGNQAQLVAAFVCGLVASIQFTTAGGRTGFAYRYSTAVSPDITDATVFNNVCGTNTAPGNGYNAYGGFATRTTDFLWLQRGTVTGTFQWADSYVNQIFWNSQFQNDLASYRTQVKNIPYNASGYNGIYQALASDIQTMGEFGGWSANVALSSTVQQEINQDAGMTIAPTVQSQGWYLLVQSPSASVQQARGSPIIKFYYNDGGDVGMIDMTSTVVES